MNLISDDVCHYFFDFLSFIDFLNLSKCRKIDKYKSILDSKLSKMTDVKKWLIDNDFGENATKESTVTKTFIELTSPNGYSDYYEKTYNIIEKLCSNDNDSYFNPKVTYYNLVSYVNGEIFKKLLALFGKELITEDSILNSANNFYIFEYLLFNFNKKYDILSYEEYFDTLCNNNNDKIINFIISNVPRDHLICCLFYKVYSFHEAVLTNTGPELFFKFVNSTQCYEQLATYNSCDPEYYCHMLERTYELGGDISKIREIFNLMIPYMVNCFKFKKFKTLVINDMFTDKFIKKMIYY